MRNITRDIKKLITTSYGYVANSTLSPAANAATLLKHMPTWHYFSRPANLAMHDLTKADTTVPKSLNTIIGLGLKFCPTPRKPNRNPSESFARFHKDFLTKVFFAGKPKISDEEYDPKTHIPSDWKPKDWDIPDTIHKRFANFKSAILSKMRKPHHRSTNLLPIQQRAISTLAQRTDVLVVNCDKNLGPALINSSTYIERAFSDHLSNQDTYRELTEDEAKTHMKIVEQQLRTWLKKYSTSTKTRKKVKKSELCFLNYHFEPESKKLPVFYLTLKVHKTPWTTRPIVSCSGSLLYHLGVWVDIQLQIVATAQKSYLKNSRQLKDLIGDLTLPPGSRLFTADATSMYTNIKTDMALIEIAQYIHQREHRFSTIPAAALSEALKIIMKNNIFQFGDTYWLQLNGTAMGTPPAPTYANLYFAIHENRIIKNFSTNLIVYKRYIDDIFGIWIPSGDNATDETKWLALKADIDKYHGLKWIFSPRCEQVDFLDITVSIVHERIHTTLFEKDLNLYLYIPPHSAHPPGVLTGLVIGNCHRIHTLCSDSTDKDHLLRQFFTRLRARGYPATTLAPLFERARLLALTPPPLASITDTLALTDEDMMKKRIFFHIEYHPDSPRSSTLQEIWKTMIMQSTSEPHLSVVQNNNGHDIELDQMTVVYSRPRNLGNLLSSRNLHLTTGPPVSSYRK